MATIDPFAVGMHLEEHDDTTHVVSLWYLPGGYDVLNARVMYLFYPSQEDAEQFALKWRNTQELPVVMTIEKYREIKRKEAERLEAFQNSHIDFDVSVVDLGQPYAELHPTDPWL